MRISDCVTSDFVAPVSVLHRNPTVLCKSNENEFRALFSSKYWRTFD